MSSSLHYGLLDEDERDEWPIASEPGREGERLQAGQYSGMGVAVLTSGGDAQGMNAAVRAVVRTGLYTGCRVFFVHEGYQGLVDGGERVAAAGWDSVSGIIERGGTEIGSARCGDFRERRGRLAAAAHLVQRGICRLVVIGGDGSLTGADCFRREWPQLLDELAEQAVISSQQRQQYAHLSVVGMVGSIDNDFCGTDMTIGTDSALHRICEACDAITATAYSHQRCFIMEVMGRHCGYLALASALAAEASYVFLPENPPTPEWRQHMCAKLHAERQMGRRLNIVIVAEGAVDRSGAPITGAQVCHAVQTELGYDTRVTVLGHVQRGGNASAFDRVLASRMGSEALLAVVTATRDEPAAVIALRGNRTVRVSLEECVRKTQAVAAAMADGHWESAVRLRGAGFARSLATFRSLTRLPPPPQDAPPTSPRESRALAVLHVGAPCSGMNAAVRSFVRTCVSSGWPVLGVLDGFEGLVTGRVRPLGWADVSGWTASGGARLGIKRTLPGPHVAQVAEKLRQHRVAALLLVGGFDGFASLLQLAEARGQYEELCIPLLLLPATIDNNVPGTELTLGCDSALNQIADTCSRLRHSAQGSGRRTFIVETMGGHCGYLASVGALATGADACYIEEQPFTAADLLADIGALSRKMLNTSIQRGLVLRSQLASANYTTELVCRLYSEEARGVFSCRQSVPGHLQQAGAPSPFDRCLAAKMAARCAHWMLQRLESDKSADGAANIHGQPVHRTDSSGAVAVQEPRGARQEADRLHTSGSESVCVLGLRRQRYEFTPACRLAAEADWRHRTTLSPWWLRLRNLQHVLDTYVETPTAPRADRV